MVSGGGGERGSDAARRAARRRGRVLVVDDDEPIRRLVGMALLDDGYEVLSASNGAIALEHAREHAPDVVLLDMNMPIMDGWEFFKRYQELSRQRAPVVVMTAAASAQTRAEQLGADAWLGKPFDLEDLAAVVKRFLPPDPSGLPQERPPRERPSRAA